MTTTVDALVEAYLDRLNHAARDLPPDRRSDLLESIGEHISAARAAGAAADEAAVRTLLDRLGEPDDIVAAARDDRDGGEPTATPQLVAVQPGTGRELGAVLMLTVGSLLPVIGWLAGVALLWSSRRWRTREKLLGTLVVPGGPAVVVPLGPLAVRGSAGDVAGWESFLVIALLILAPVVVAVLLLRAAGRRAALEKPVLRAVPQQTSPWGGLEVAALLLLAGAPSSCPSSPCWSASPWCARPGSGAPGPKAPPPHSSSCCPPSPCSATPFGCPARRACSPSTRSDRSAVCSVRPCLPSPGPPPDCHSRLSRRWSGHAQGPAPPCEPGPSRW